MVILERQITKTKTTREVYLPPELMNALIRRANGLQLKGNDFLFFNQSPTKSTQFTRPLSSQCFDKELRPFCDWNGLSRISFHFFLQTPLMELYRDGWPPIEIQHISVHRSLQQSAY